MLPDSDKTASDKTGAIPLKNPNFFTIGVVKAGTSSLHHYLEQHPHVYMSPIKETNYFSRKDIDSSLFSKAYLNTVNVDLNKYLSSNMREKIHIAHITEEKDYLRLFSNVTNETAIGESSNSYILCEESPGLIHQAYPKAKIIIMLRNPVKRIFSHYLMNLRLGITLENDLITELKNDQTREINGWGANHQYFSIGLYYEQVKRIYDVFPAEQILLCYFEDYQQDGAAIMKKIYHFLGVKDDFKPDITEKINVAGIAKFKILNYLINYFGFFDWARRRLPVTWRKLFKKYWYTVDKKSIPVMSAEEKQYLVNYYREDIINLGKFLKKDLSHWLN